MTIEGRTGFVPNLGIGYGAAAGVLIGGAAAPLGLDLGPSQVLMVDLGAGLGGLTAAAAASPLVALGDANRARHRLWLSSIALGTLAGALVGYALAPEGSDDDSSLPRLLPIASFIPAHGRHPAAAQLGVAGEW
jgi:hypothetical protein